ncbi:MAG: glycosyltransferase family 4 protein, partial [Nitrospirota bacterium]
MNNKVKILHVLWVGGIGGAEEYVRMITRYLNSSRYDNAVCFLSQRGEICQEIQREGNVSLTSMGFRNGFDVEASVKFYKYVRENGFDIIHIHVRNILSMLVLALFFSRIPKIITHHTGIQLTDPDDIRKFKKSKLFYFLFSRFLRKIIAISGYVKDNLIRNMGISPAEKIEVLHNGIDMQVFDRVRRTTPELLNVRSVGGKVIGFIGRMVPCKRPELFIQCAAEIIKRDTGYR